MGKYQDGLLGTIRGKVGPIVGSRWRGIPYLRSKGPSTRSNNSEKQLIQQAKFRVAVSFIRQMTDLFRVTFKKQAQEKTTRNFALSQVVSEAISGTYPNFVLDYSKVTISTGTLAKPMQATMNIVTGIAHWEWFYNASFQLKLAKNRAILVVYCPAFEASLYELFGPERSETTAPLDVTPFMGQTVHTWLAFISEDGEQISDSVYTGQATVS
jgi:hypothetical protein